MSTNTNTSKIQNMYAVHVGEPGLARRPNRLEAQASSRQALRLLSPKAIGLAGFFGGPIAGGVALAVNFFLLPGLINKIKGIASLIGGTLMTVIIGVVLMLMPPIPMAGIFVGVGTGLTLKAMAAAMFAQDYALASRQKVKSLSSWLGVVIGLGMGVAALIVALNLFG